MSQNVSNTVRLFVEGQQVAHANVEHGPEVALVFEICFCGLELYNTDDNIQTRVVHHNNRTNIQ
jgi:hypothetical protein